MFNALKDNYNLFSLSGVPEIATLILAVLAISLLGWWLTPYLRNYLVKLKIRGRVKKLGTKILSNIRLPDGVDGELYIDHIVLGRDKIIVVDVKHYDGLIYGNESLDQWTQVVNQKNFQFKNPLMQIQDHITAVQTILPEMRVEGMVLFAGRSRFPKRTPDGVFVLRDLPQQSQKLEIPEDVLSSWQRLCEYRQRVN